MYSDVRIAVYASGVKSLCLVVLIDHYQNISLDLKNVLSTKIVHCEMLSFGQTLNGSAT